MLALAIPLGRQARASMIKKPRVNLSAVRELDGHIAVCERELAALEAQEVLDV